MRRLLSALGLSILVATTVYAAQAQTPAPAARVFDVVSVKPSNPDPANPMSMVPMAMPAGNRFTATNMPLRVLVRIAYELQDFQIAGGPSWQLSSKFDIQAKAEEGFAGGTREIMPMLKAVLADRFKLKVHMEKREMPISALVIARSDGRLGPDIKASTSDCPSPEEQAKQQAEAIAKGGTQALVAQMMAAGTCMMAPIMPTGPGPATFGMRGNGQPILQIVQLLTQATGRIVEDRTGLKGLYDFTLTFDPQVLMAAVGQLGMTIPGGGQLPPSDNPSLLTAIQEQLGLKLSNERGQVDVLVIDSAEMPTVD